MTMSITIPDFGSSAATQVGAPAPSKVNVKKVVILLLLAVLVAVPVTMYWTNVCFMTQAMILETFGSEEQLTQLIYDYLVGATSNNIFMLPSLKPLALNSAQQWA